MTKFLGFQKKKQIGYKEERCIVQTGKKAFTIIYEKERSKAVFCNLGGLYGKVVVRFGGH